MTDLEITRLCADAMGFHTLVSNKYPMTVWPEPDSQAGFTYDPILDDAQAMKLVKKFRLRISQPGNTSRGWLVHVRNSNNLVTGNFDLNRAICECVAKMQAAK